MTKTVTINVPVEVRKNGTDDYEFAYPGGIWSGPLSEAQVRRNAREGYAGARAIVQAIDSGAFVDPLPTAEGALIYNPELKVHFFRASAYAASWISSSLVDAHHWHSPEQVQSYGPFEVLYDPEKKEG